MGICNAQNNFTCERCGSDRFGYLCHACQVIACSCEDCPGCVTPELPASYAREMSRLDETPHETDYEDYKYFDQDFDGYPP